MSGSSLTNLERKYQKIKLAPINNFIPEPRSQIFKPLYSPTRQSRKQTKFILLVHNKYYQVCKENMIQNQEKYQLWETYSKITERIELVKKKKCNVKINIFHMLKKV